jgi:hypothetical protein
LKNRQGEADFQKMIKPNTIRIIDGMIRANINSSKYLLYSTDVGDAFNCGLAMS